MGTIGSKSMGCQIWQRGSMAALGSRTEYICPHPLNLVFPFSASAMRAIPPMDLEEGSQVTQPVQAAQDALLHQVRVQPGILYQYSPNRG